MDWIGFQTSCRRRAIWRQSKDNTVITLLNRFLVGMISRTVTSWWWSSEQAVVIWRGSWLMSPTLVEATTPINPLSANLSTVSDTWPRHSSTNLRSFSCCSSTINPPPPPPPPPPPDAPDAAAASLRSTITIVAKSPSLFSAN